MKSITPPQYETLVQSAKILAMDAHGVKVMETRDGQIVKLFRRKRMFSSALFFPYAERFVRNAGRLRRGGFHTVNVLDVYRVPALKRDCVVYPRIPGRTVREIARSQAKDPASSESLMLKVSFLLSSLHREGFLFRSAHLGNIVVKPDGELALIDVSDLRRWPFGSLPLAWRWRNFSHLWRYPEDRLIVRQWGEEVFVDAYLGETGLRRRSREVLREHLRAVFRNSV